MLHTRATISGLTARFRLCVFGVFCTCYLHGFASLQFTDLRVLCTRVEVHHAQRKKLLNMLKCRLNCLNKKLTFL